MNRKTLLAWASYDWANSAINTIVFTFVFSVYFQKSVYGDVVGGTAAWSYAQGAAGLGIAVLSPVLGAALDKYGPAKPALKILTALCVALTALLFAIKPGHAYIVPALVITALLSLFFELAQNTYNATLPRVAPPHKLGHASGIGWGAGYIGSILSLAIVLFGFIGLGGNAGFFGLSKDNALHIRAGMVFVALWFAAFALPFFMACPDAAKTGLTLRASIKAGLAELAQTWQQARALPSLFRFLVVSAIYRDGLATLFAVGGLYAGGTLGMTITQIMLFAIAINITSGMGAIAFAFIDDRIGPKTTIGLGLVALMALGATAISVSSISVFIGITCALGVFVGPVQASSRALLVQLSPPEKTATMFGLYALTGKSVAFLGPLAFGALTQLFETQRAGMAGILVFWLAGLLGLYFVKHDRHANTIPFAQLR